MNIEFLKAAMLEIQRLAADKTLDSKSKFDLVSAKVSEVFDAENKEWNEKLLYFAESTSWGISEIVADEYEKRMTQSQADSNGVFAELNALPVLFLTDDRDFERAQWIDSLPPLPSGKPIPLISDVLFSWDDLIRNQPSIWALLRSVKNGQSISGEQLSVFKERREPFGRYDPAILNAEKKATLRFLLSYRRSTDPNFYQSAEEKLAWADKARRALGEGIDVRAPRKFSEALYASDGMIKYFYSTNLVNAALDHGCEPRSIFLLAEDFGHAERGMSGYLRISVCNSSPENWLWRTLIFRAIPSDRVRWRHGNEQFRLSCNAAGIKTLIVDHIQSAKLVENPIECVRLNLFFGPSILFEETPPDGYPADIFSRSSIDEATKRWLDYDFESLSSTFGLVKAMLESALDETEISDAERGFSLRDGIWRPSLMVDIKSVKPAKTCEMLQARMKEILNPILAYLQVTAAVKRIDYEIEPQFET